ncbi:Probable intracellular septation protein A [Candidatus Erwinia haradaeae]|uniref:Inner membrane-spanning protein YciB n=1 Tax=Candidatus Erwinia haradaeae TaxID=1922217 RepID=A0A451DD94_9GAMM|nr:septation protein A [Candidatus Erwinia haradaeae]VFP84402.1 Probable intracellular septation protein A [Candidatus Erwinia haradaeae]
MKQYLDILPLFVFFLAYKTYDVFIASGALMLTSAMAICLKFFVYRKLDKISIITFMLVMVLGTLTIILHNPDFIKWKATIIYGCFSISLFFSHFFMSYSLIQKIAHTDVQLPEVVWRRLNIAWATFFLFCGIANVYAIFYLSQERWIDFKFFGLGGLTFLFAFLSGLYVLHFISKKDD